MPRRTTPRLLVLATAGLTALALTGCTADPAPPALGATEPVAVEAAPSTSSAPVVEAVEPTEAAASPASSPVAEQTPMTRPTPKAPKATYDVAAVQQKLKDLKYYIGAVDGRPGPALRSSVMAFQKVNGLGVDGAVGASTLQALEAPRAPSLKGSSPANRVEVDLTKQVAYVVKGGAVTRIVPVSSGNGATYGQKDGSKARALTPVGYYKIQRRIIGERKADLGTLYDPQYFYKGWAIHGSNSVPAGPASHGCVRVTRADAKYLLDVINVGTTVYLYGGTHTFKAGSSAPGTDAPTGDTSGGTSGSTTEPSPSPSPTSTRPASSPTATRTASPTPTRTPATSPSPSPSPSATRASEPTSAPEDDASASPAATAR